MSKALKMSENTTLNPTLPQVELIVDNGTFYLAYTFKALAIAQKNLRDIGVECNLLRALDLTNMDAEKFVPLLYAGLITHQPKITLDKVFDLVQLKNLGSVFEAIVTAYAASIAEPDKDDKGDRKENPTQAV